MTQSAIGEVLRDDPSYPALLAHTARPPARLYYRGILPSETQPLIAVVGTRTMSVYGQRVVETLIPPLVRAGYAIVSGLAYGIDACVHKTTLEAGGVTHTVLGSGVDEGSIYPAAHRSLARAIVEQGGCILSEFAPGTTPRKQFFPMRNRIVAGMCRGVVVVEAPERSGALITAFQALDENREVFAVPGPITHRNTRGTHMLIRLGAHIVTEAADIFRGLGDDEHTGRKSEVSVRARAELSEIETKILDCINEEPVHIDAFEKETLLDIQTINSTLGIMELKGVIKNVGQMNYIRCL